MTIHTKADAMAGKGAAVWSPQQVVAHYSRLGLAPPAELFASVGTVVMPNIAGPVSIKPPRRSKEPNQTEREFGAMLERRKRAGEFETVQFEAVRLKLAPGLTYEPDWFCTRPLTSVFSQRPRHHRPCIFEVKGRKKWDDAIAKFKMAREVHKWAHFEMWEKLPDGRWQQMF